MDYKEEQAGEIEALESIYYGDVRILSSEPFHKFSIPIKSEQYDPDTEDGITCNLIFTYTSKYPDEQPLIEIEEPVNINNSHQQDLLKQLKGEAEENIGMVMVFTLVSLAQEWVNVKWDEVKKQREDEKMKMDLEREELERKKFEGTRVTVESFLIWKNNFEKDMGIIQKRESADKGQKLTGRELFMTDNTLNESDLKFLDGEEIKVDESLFQDLDDLDIDDEDDDPDFDPNNFDSDNS
ncbi:hypothetical protein RN001_005209 [Aquatica leii]|uniref:RWD domain-containing protein n=1 Tax=Aquatica leii TaxID=1421715 RepID=A0AAN7P6A3_9COLE|nr:hypothetical protein RN001_005209 [Aquatica leii]